MQNLRQVLQREPFFWCPHKASKSFRSCT